MYQDNCSLIISNLESLTKEELLQIQSVLDKKLNINSNNLRLEDEELEFINSIVKK